MIGDAGEDVAQAGERVDAVELAGFDQSVDRGGAGAAAVGAGEQPVLPKVILPMSGRKSKSCYRWHALHGRRVRRQHAERRAGGVVVHVEVAPGVVIVVAAWMLDPVACAGMALGAPRVAVSALVDLHHLLIERGFRRSSLDDPTIVQEERDEKPADTGAAIRRRASSACRSIPEGFGG